MRRGEALERAPHDDLLASKIVALDLDAQLIASIEPECRPFTHARHSLARQTRPGHRDRGKPGSQSSRNEKASSCESSLVAAVAREEVSYVVGLPGAGHETEVFFSDLSHEYVTINAEYTT